MRRRALLHIDGEPLIDADRLGYRFVVIGAADGYERRVIGMAHTQEAAFQVAAERPDAYPAVYQLQHANFGEPKWERIR